MRSTTSDVGASPAEPTPEGTLESVDPPADLPDPDLTENAIK